MPKTNEENLAALGWSGHSEIIELPETEIERDSNGAVTLVTGYERAGDEGRRSDAGRWA